MNYPKYHATVSPDILVFEFISIGRFGSIPKIIRFTKTENELIYNLGFGNRVSGQDELFEIEDSVVSNNGDRDKVLATIAYAIYVFTEHYPDLYVYFTGTSDSRNRLYRMAISNNIRELSANFSIFGIVSKSFDEKDQAVKFEASGNYKGILIKKNNDGKS